MFIGLRRTPHTFFLIRKLSISRHTFHDKILQYTMTKYPLCVYAFVVLRVYVRVYVCVCICIMCSRCLSTIAPSSFSSLVYFSERNNPLPFLCCYLKRSSARGAFGPTTWHRYRLFSMFNAIEDIYRDRLVCRHIIFA